MRKVVVFIQCCFVMRTKVGQSYVRYYEKCCLEKGDTNIADDQQIYKSSLTIDILGDQAQGKDLAVVGLYCDSTA